MTIQELELSALKPYENNPRNNEQAIDKVAASITQFGFKVPIIIDRENTIVAGHTVFPGFKKSPYKTSFANLPYFMRVCKRFAVEKIKKIR